MFRLRLPLQFTLMLKNPSELKRFETINNECSFVLTESIAIALYSGAKYAIAYIYPDLNQCNVFALCSEFVRPPCPYLVFPLNAL